GLKQPAHAGAIVFVNDFLQLRAIHCLRTSQRTRAHSLSVLSEAGEIVQEIHEQEFFAHALREAHASTKLERSAIELKQAVTLMVVDNGHVVELRRADT